MMWTAVPFFNIAKVGITGPKWREIKAAKRRRRRLNLCNVFQNENMCTFACVTLSSCSAPKHIEMNVGKYQSQKYHILILI
jgi:hypothetical protein